MLTLPQRAGLREPSKGAQDETIEYLQEVVEFLMSHEGVVEELDDEPENASLF